MIQTVDMQLIVLCSSILLEKIIGCKPFIYFKKSDSEQLPFNETEDLWQK